MINQDLTNRIEKDIYELTTLRGISSNEHSVAEVLADKLKNICDCVEIDFNGNIIGFIKCSKNNPKILMLEAHMDRIGLMVSKIGDDGLVEFTSIGGIDKRVLPSAEVEIVGKDIVQGVICVEKNKKDTNPDIEDMRIDTGFSVEYLRKNIKTGDMAFVKSSCTKLCGTVLSGPALDNRAGIAAVLSAIYDIDKAKLNYDIAILFSVQEELGLHGAYTGTRSINPDVAIVIDVTHGETNDTKGETGVFQLGCGAVICRGPNFNSKYTRQLIDIAEDNSLPYDIEVASGPSGTTAWAIQITGKGVPSTLISIPLRYMHTNVETLDLNDVSTCALLMKKAIEGGIVLD